MNPSRKTQLLEQIAAIPAMERGKFSPVPRTGIKNFNAGRRGGITPGMSLRTNCPPWKARWQAMPHPGN